jgi:hypothetical protein
VVNLNGLSTVRSAIQGLVFLTLVFGACKKIEYAPREDAGTSDAGKRDAATERPDAGTTTDGGLSDASAGGSSDAGLTAGALPARTSDELTLRMRHLMEAIVNDNADLGRDALYPRKDFLKRSSTKDPSHYWDKRIYEAFQKSIHRLHKKIHGVDRAKFQSFDVGTVSGSVQSKEWTGITHQSKHGKLLMMIDGKPVTIPVAELVAYDGHWYLLKL